MIEAIATGIVVVLLGGGAVGLAPVLSPEWLYVGVDRYLWLLSCLIPTTDPAYVESERRLVVEGIRESYEFNRSEGRSHLAATIRAWIDHTSELTPWSAVSKIRADDRCAATSRTSLPAVSDGPGDAAAAPKQPFADAAPDRDAVSVPERGRFVTTVKVTRREMPPLPLGRLGQDLVEADAASQALRMARSANFDAAAEALRMARSVNFDAAAETLRMARSVNFDAAAEAFRAARSAGLTRAPRL